MPEFVYENKVYYNSVEFLMDRIGGTWKMPILFRLQKKSKRYGELKKSLPKISDKMLAASLRELEEDGFVNRKVYPVIPPKVEYSLTERGKQSIPIIEILRQYGKNLMSEYGIDVSEE